ncbi:hypothetical protein BGP34_15035 [Bacillus mycoides]|uniref:hypothetical protein n=1 Tax=Bacillus mycoides TaxID=1405 RepID=UPI000991EF26|nr:hypothetical protein [Bacillus mycoides]MED4682489.1 hypothetical protein [Bacillus mycoides]OOR57154.1 hypothetical protein BGP34_15035 [Bacillus mycoides]
MKKWIIWAVIFYIHSAVLLYKGIDKIEGYYMASEYSELNKHVYVGGDAYNYIINSNLLTVFFVLSAEFFIAGTLLIATGSIIKALKEKKWHKRLNYHIKIAIYQLVDRYFYDMTPERLELTTSTLSRELPSGL